jgi:hypothetical protein
MIRDSSTKKRLSLRHKTRLCSTPQMAEAVEAFGCEPHAWDFSVLA